MARVLVVGNGGREHALCWALARSPQVEKIYTNKSNPGAQALAKFGGVLGGGGDFSALARAAKDNGITLAVIGPEAPLADGVVDAFAARGLVALGPRRQAARLESSKSYAKKIMARARIPTAAWFLARDIGEAKRALRKLEHPAVVKADGLAAGKGVVVCDDIESAERAAIEMLGGRFGEASRAVVIEERLTGREASVIALADGENVALLPSAQDYKRLLPGDEGPNTGGMGAISPARADSETLAERVLERAILPALAAIEEETGAPYRGFLFAGVMARENGDFRVLEFNCRLGDPEAQAVLPRLQGDFFAALDACANGNSVFFGVAARPPKRGGDAGRARLSGRAAKRRSHRKFGGAVSRRRRRRRDGAVRVCRRGATRRERGAVHRRGEGGERRRAGREQRRSGARGATGGGANRIRRQANPRRHWRLTIASGVKSPAKIRR